jgi:hypothetical protein
MILAKTDAKAAVGYARRSTDRQEQSIGDQKRTVENWAEADGLELLDWYVDDAIMRTTGSAWVIRHRQKVNSLKTVRPCALALPLF